MPQKKWRNVCSKRQCSKCLLLFFVAAAAMTRRNVLALLTYSATPRDETMMTMTMTEAGPETATETATATVTVTVAMTVSGFLV